MQLTRNYRNAGRHGIVVHHAMQGSTLAQAPYFAGFMGALVSAYAVQRALPVPAAVPSVVLQYHTGKAAYYRVTWYMVHNGTWLVARVAISARNMARTRVLSVKYQ